MRVMWVGVLIALVGCGGGSSGGSQPSNVAVNGTVIVYDVSGWIDHCTRLGANDDVSDGASVTISNASGTVVGTATLSATGRTGGPSFTTEGCRYTFTASVPSSAFYGIQVGAHNKVTFPLAKVRAGPTLTLDAN